MHNKKSHNQAETITYAYDVQGRLTSHTSSSSKLNYNIGYDQTGGILTASPKYNGNISYMSWKNGSNADRAYVYSYDKLSQLTAADFREKIGVSWQDISNYDVGGLSYDENGNMKSVTRNNSSGGTLQNFSYTYGDGGNKLTSVNGGGTYTYNANGNMLYDGRKGITIKYNELNLPEKISKGSESISYIYTADGRKLAMEFGSSLIYYRGGLIYNGDALDRIMHEEGQVVKTSGGYNYYYTLKDHLGSTRALCKASGSSLITEQTTEYYPFGLAYSYNSVDKNAYLFSGKEYQNELIDGTKLELYDFGSRFYDAEIGRWSAVDPAMQLVSPYGYCGNNPVNNIDPDGEFFWPLIASILGSIAINTAEKAINQNMSLGDAFMSSLQMPMTNVGIGDWRPETVGMYAQRVEKRMSEIVSGLDKFTDSQSGAVARSEISLEARSGGIHIEVNRFGESPDATISKFTAYGPVPLRPLFGYFLEPGGPPSRIANQDKRILPGEYILAPYSSDNYPYHYILSNEYVSKDRRVLIHSGNYHKNTLACLLPGDSYSRYKGNYAVWNSKKTLGKLQQLIGNSSVTLNINGIYNLPPYLWR